MRQISPILLCVALIVPVAHAEEADQGFSLMERGAQLFFEGLMKEMEPAIEEFQDLGDNLAPTLRQFADEMGPKMTDMMTQIEDWSQYEAPEVLPNGDIIIRRKPKPVEKLEESPQVDL